MKIELKNRGLLFVYDEGRSIKITGELSAGPHYIFYADLVSLDYWVVGMGKTRIEDSEKKIIIQKIQEEGRYMNLEILFD